MKAEECLIDNAPFSFFQIHVLYCNSEQNNTLASPQTTGLQLCKHCTSTLYTYLNRNAHSV